MSEPDGLVVEELDGRALPNCPEAAMRLAELVTKRSVKVTRPDEAMTAVVERRLDAQANR
jgi:hypothetical protein